MRGGDTLGAEATDSGDGVSLSRGLYIVGTPIGNLGDLSPRARDTLAQASVIYAEDTRVTRRILARHGLATPLRSCHRFREQARVEEVLQRIRDGQAVALASDSGMPAVSDPGARVVAGCRAAGLPVTAVPGPSAVTAAMALCGFEAAGFHFAGFLPSRPGARGKRLDALLTDEDPVIVFESPYRVLRLLQELDARAPDRPVFVGRELTKRFEETRVDTAAALAARFSERKPRGEFVLVIAPKARTRTPDPEPES